VYFQLTQCIIRFLRLVQTKNVISVLILLTIKPQNRSVQLKPRPASRNMPRSRNSWEGLVELGLRQLIVHQFRMHKYRSVEWLQSLPLPLPCLSVFWADIPLIESNPCFEGNFIAKVVLETDRQTDRPTCFNCYLHLHFF
jgi:hypothetical protein